MCFLSPILPWGNTYFATLLSIFSFLWPNHIFIWPNSPNSPNWKQILPTDKMLSKSDNCIKRLMVYLGSDLWIQVSLTNNQTFVRLNWCDSGWWRYQLNTNWQYYSVNGVIQYNVTTQVMQPGGQLWNQCRWGHLMTKFGTNASGANWWLNLQPMQLGPSGGQIYTQYR